MRQMRAIVLTLFWLLTGCAALDPPPKTIQQRLDMLPRRALPLERPVLIRWNGYQVPFIEAETDHDLAYALGLVHAHLRLGQIRLLKQISQGRLSEMAGPWANDVDQALRILDYGHAVPEILRELDPATRSFLEAFVAGLNDYQDQMVEPPPEFSLLGLRREPFRPEDLITIGRLAGTDVNWLIELPLLRLRNRPDWPLIWSRMLSDGNGSTTSFGQSENGAFRDIFLGSVRSGSNAVVVAPEHSTTGTALIAADPHLSLSVPNLWLLAGMRAPGIAGVGLMVPGLPFIAEGRNADLAWAGTNMRAANSDIYDIARLADAGIETRQTTIRTRFWLDASRTLRTSRFGPIISDSRYVASLPGETLALRWIGHRPTDEINALFRVMQAKDAKAFRAALAGFAVSPQNLLCADTRGNVCQALATVVPRRRPGPPAGLVLDANDPANHWTSFADAETLPFGLNPPEGFLASANNRPTDTDVPLGYFFSSDERIRRLKQIVGGRPRVSLDDLKTLQRDTVSLDSAALAKALAEFIDAEEVAANPAFLTELETFDGDYRVDAHAPVVFESLLYHLVPAVYGADSPDGLPSAYSGLNHLVHWLLPDLKQLPDGRRRAILRAALDAAEHDSQRFVDWGEMHRLPIQHWLANLPLVGGFFRYADYPVGGSRETIMKTAHGLVDDVNAATYGSQARFLTDMGDPDSSQFVLIGGNDGWLGSANALDQVPLWLNGDYIRIPLTPERVAKEFPLVTVLKPDD
jgi:penicillin amidase